MSFLLSYVNYFLFGADIPLRMFVVKSTLFFKYSLTQEMSMF